MASGKTNYLENKYLDWLLRAQSFTAPATAYVRCGNKVSIGTHSSQNWAATVTNGPVLAFARASVNERS